MFCTLHWVTACTQSVRCLILSCERFISEINKNGSVLCCPWFEYAVCTSHKNVLTVFLQYLVDPKIR